jgi:hypothetical protein
MTRPINIIEVFDSAWLIFYILSASTDLLSTSDSFLIAIDQSLLLLCD